jgi:hypothetical protein
MRVVKGETWAALMDVLRVVIVLAAVAFQWFTGHPASLLRDAVTEVIARKRFRLAPFGGSVDLNRSRATTDIPGPFHMESHSTTGGKDSDLAPTLRS